MPGPFSLRLAAVFAVLQSAAATVGHAAEGGPAVLGAALAVAAGAGAGLVLGARASRVAREIESFAERVADGQLTARVPAAGGDEFADAARAVNRMAERLARESAARAHFIGKVSHELRTPITVIRGYAFSLGRREREPARLEKLDVINGECERLAYLVEDLLELSRAQAGELRVSAETFPLRDCVEEVAERLRPFAEGHDVGIDVHWTGNGALVMGDQNRVRQIFQNLLTNGIKYAPPGTQVRVLGDSSGEDLSVRVEDDGRGIAETDLPHIFTPFYQSPDRSEAGAGLGLAIVRELVVAHGGRIDVASAVGAGTSFTVTLPAWEEL